MLLRRRPGRVASAALLGLTGWLLQACATPGASKIVGPDGSPMAHVHCGSDQAACFRLAGELCPTGYDLKPVMSGSDGNFLVRCRAAALAALPQQCGTLAAASPGASNSGWPPASEPWPAAYPWPPPETTAGALPPAKGVPGGVVDLGY